MGKLPAFQFYPGDWLKDPKLGSCKPATRGIWIDALCAMHELDRCGQLSGTMETLARVCRCRENEFRAAVEDLLDSGAADVTYAPPLTTSVMKWNGIVTLTNRRQRREWQSRQQAKNRVDRWRGKNEASSRDGPVTPKLRSYSSSSPSSSNLPSEDFIPAASGGGEESIGQNGEPSVEAYELAQALKDAIAKRDPRAKAARQGNIGLWARDIDRLIRIDGRTPEEVRQVIVWCQQDRFWATNILSGGKLRDEFDRLSGQMQQRRNGDSPRPQQTPGANRESPGASTAAGPAYVPKQR